MLRLGTRASPLARWQADFVANELQKRGCHVEIVLITTSGDRRQHEAPVGPDPIVDSGAQGLFTKEIQQRLLLGEIDLAVHSLKDLPTDEVEGLKLAAVPERGPPRDMYISHHFPSWRDLPEGAVVGTGSRRRRAQLLALRPDLTMREIRGNVDTRLSKMERKEYDAIVLAEAGVLRLGITAPFVEIFSNDEMLPAIGQGALGIEVRAEDNAAFDAVYLLNDAKSWAAVAAERSMLRALRGGCLAPVGAATEFDGQHRLTLTGGVFGPHGNPRLIANSSASISEAEELGRAVADLLTGQGADAVISAARDG